MKLPLYIAGRYLFARKSHNVINVISAVGAIGMTVGTAALVLILSIYNGFDSIIRNNLSDLDPDILVTDGSGAKHFTIPEGLEERIAAIPGVSSVCEVLQDNVFFTYGGQQGLARALGVDDSYASSCGLAGHIVDGSLTFRNGDIDCVVVGSTLAYENGIRPRFVDNMTLFYPDPSGTFSPSNPAASLCSEKVRPSGIFSISADIDGSLMIIPIDAMRRLLGWTGKSSGLQVRLSDPKAASAVNGVCGSYGCTALDRYRQHPEIYRMMRYEKAAVFLILIFIVIIVAFNIFGSLSMLIIEKEDDIRTLRCLGATDRTVKGIFTLEGLLISMIGMVAGLLLGTVLCIIQQKAGIVKMPGNFLLQAYPVEIQAGDILLTLLCVSLTGLLISMLATRRIQIKE